MHLDKRGERELSSRALPRSQQCGLTPVLLFIRSDGNTAQLSVMAEKAVPGEDQWCD